MIGRSLTRKGNCLILCTCFIMRFRKIYVYLFWRNYREREGGGGRDRTTICQCTPQVATMAGTRLGQSQEPGASSASPVWVSGIRLRHSQEPGASSASPMWVQGSQPLGPPAFSGELGWQWSSWDMKPGPISDAGVTVVPLVAVPQHWPLEWHFLPVSVVLNCVCMCVSRKKRDRLNMTL